MGCLCFGCPHSQVHLWSYGHDIGILQLSKLQSVVRGAIFLAGDFLAVIDTLALLAWWIICLEAVSWTLLGAQLGVSNFSLRKDTYVTDLVLLLLNVTILVSRWM